MPPLLAALLMIELGCPVNIVQAIDLNMEWRDYWQINQRKAKDAAQCWYDGYLGCESDVIVGTYLWPIEYWGGTFSCN
jgi:hypothetical protein